MKIMPIKKIRAKINVPPDKSISHRILILSSLANEKSVVYNILNSKDVKRTYNILKKIGIKFKGDFNKLIIIPNKITTPTQPLYCGNSGTTARLMSGVLSSKNGLFILYGDKSLSKRPMKRIIEPLNLMGAEIKSRNGEMPLIIKGGNLKGIEYTMPIPSAQLKSSIILAGLNAKGETIVRGDKGSRDHTERILKYMNAKIEVNNEFIKIKKSELKPIDKFNIPGDFSSAAFFIALGILHKNAKVEIYNVNLNPTRIGFLKILKKMNANIYYEVTEKYPEPIGKIVIETSNELEGINVPKELIPNAIDELPLLALVATQAKGKTILRNAKELRVKESDRIKAVVNNMERIGIKIKELEDGFEIEGKQKIIGGKIKTYNDHRITMMFSIAGLLSKEGIEINNPKIIDISFPGFYKIIKHLEKDEF
ncbi:3-phosphoshikimate 1-carboxyvinyltransferase [Marinitoga hydrogenitolerans DSM 16785]|uniref:3-phosphoshikimate 1-carboxyvinyltransferase n=1 Tax=Marinitoga hydrogenitolerans (strain DSM 16785 / JCM 12826 / AT1271) TaxID=1122195 RepID=A0A1M4XGU7_MARH1|nr:3-phosphoshikimate 1-carboxyvinyltransferase [Marinitoga hydrogenitolerans]SHE92392.1 3-phosphoshikimate 1-carboxyvinyltransferase [Marinitoga hydrogenitolerans DSM 16785]